MQIISVVSKSKRIYQWATFIALGLGVAVRIAVYLQNRNLMIDESNVARNVYERGFAALVSPLSYEQYAPPIWLWEIKLNTLLFGFSEYALRLLPLLSGVLSLVLMYLVLKALDLYRATWYPLALMCVGYMFIRYSTELKQYSTDILIALTLILLALKTNVQQTSLQRFYALWLIAGSIAIWGSMPSVFILAGVGGYYFLTLLQNREYKKILPLSLVALLWVVQFGLYYWFILKAQANSDYLQNYHKDYFLSATPTTLKEWDHNLSLMGQVLGEAGGFTFLAKAMHTLFIAWACIYLVTKNRPLFALLVVPFLLLLVAAAANQYTMIPRVVLFVMPLLLILVGYAMNMMMATRQVYQRALMIAACSVCLVNVSALRFLIVPLETEQLTDALQFVQDKGITDGKHLYIHNGAVPAFIYYTTIHPEKERYAAIRDAALLDWDKDYYYVAQQVPSPCAFVYTSLDDEELRQRKVKVASQITCTDSMDEKGSHAYIYSR